MELTQEDVIQILKLLDESNFDEFRLEKEGLKLTVIKGGKRIPIPEFEVPSKGFTQLKSPEPIVPAKVREAAIPVTPPPPSNALTQIEQPTVGRDNLIRIKAPTLGTFYTRPNPASPPFVDVGAFVNEDTTVCLIEAMKCFTSIKAGAWVYCESPSPRWSDGGIWPRSLPGSAREESWGRRAE